MGWLIMRILSGSVSLTTECDSVLVVSVRWLCELRLW